MYPPNQVVVFFSLHDFFVHLRDNIVVGRRRQLLLDFRGRLFKVRPPFGGEKNEFFDDDQKTQQVKFPISI